MDRNQLIASLVDSLAWPVGALALGFMARPVIGELVTRLRTLKYGNIEAGLQTLDQLASGKEGVAGAGALSTRAPTILDPSLARLAETAPAATLEAAWRRVRDAIVTAAYTLTNEERLGMTESLDVLLRDKVLSTRDLFVFNALSSIRQAVYYDGAAISPAAVLDFIAQADQLTDKVERATEPPPPEH